VHLYSPGATTWLSVTTAPGSMTSCTATNSLCMYQTQTHRRDSPYQPSHQQQALLPSALTAPVQSFAACSCAHVHKRAYQTITAHSYTANPI
jgi:hypothetical protein